MKQDNQASKIDGFHIVVFLSIIMGFVSMVFILLTARPQELKLIKWSSVSSYNEIIESLSKRQYPVLKSTQKVTFWGLENIELTSESAARSIKQITSIDATPVVADSTLQPDHTETASKLPAQIILEPSEEKTLDVFIEVIKFVNKNDIHPSEFYDPKFLTKELQKADGPLFFTAYQKSSGQIHIDVILIEPISGQ